MKPIRGYNAAQASGEFERLAPGGYVIKITGVQDEDQKQYLRIVYDIAEGPEAGRYQNEDSEHEFIHSFVRSYKETALGMFKGFIRAIDESNGTEFDKRIEKGFPEQELVGKLVGIVLGEEEYENNRGEVKTGLKVRSVISAERVRKGDYKIPEPKKLTQATTGAPVSGFTPISDADVPF